MIQHAVIIARANTIAAEVNWRMACALNRSNPNRAIGMDTKAPSSMAPRMEISMLPFIPKTTPVQAERASPMTSEVPTTRCADSPLVANKAGVTKIPPPVPVAPTSAPVAHANGVSPSLCRTRLKFCEWRDTRANKPATNIASLSEPFTTEAKAPDWPITQTTNKEQRRQTPAAAFRKVRSNGQTTLPARWWLNPAPIL